MERKKGKGKSRGKSKGKGESTGSNKSGATKDGFRLDSRHGTARVLVLRLHLEQQIAQFVCWHDQ
jgi:hypothetical protein